MNEMDPNQVVVLENTPKLTVDDNTHVDISSVLSSVLQSIASAMSALRKHGIKVDMQENPVEISFECNFVVVFKNENDLNIKIKHS